MAKKKSVDSPKPLSKAAQLSAEAMREKYPEIAKLTIAEVVDTEAFRKAAQDKITHLYRTFTKYCEGTKYVYAASFLRLYRDNELSQLAFGTNYIDVLDKQSSLSSTDRAIIKSIGDEVYAKVVAKMIEDYDKQHEEK
jgi:NAD-dependent SIR2 family protein deacetylase